MLVTELPPDQASDLAPLPADDETPPEVALPEGQNYLSQAAVVQLLTNGQPAQIRAALPRMTPDVRRLVEAALPAP